MFGILQLRLGIISFDAHTKRLKTKRPTEKTSQGTKRPKGHNVPVTKRPRDKTSQGTKRPTLITKFKKKTFGVRKLATYVR